MKKLQLAFTKVKSISWDRAVVSLFIVHRRISPQTHLANYSVLGVNLDEKLRKKLRGISQAVLSAANQVSAYEFNSSDQDNDFLGISTAETDMAQILSLITSGSIATATCYDDLVNSWIYIARLDAPNHLPLFAVRRISQVWTTKKVSQLINMAFSNNMLIDIEQDSVFKIDRHIDFFAHEEAIFIADKKNFETAMNFRVGMENTRDELAQELVDSHVLDASEAFLALIGNNMRRLRKLSQVKKSGYYKNADFMERLKAINRKEKWGLLYSSSGTLTVNESNIDVVLRVLNNDRLRSPINAENFDVEVKRKIK